MAVNNNKNNSKASIKRGSYVKVAVDTAVIYLPCKTQSPEKVISEPNKSSNHGDKRLILMYR